MAFDGSINIDSSIDGSGFTKGLDKLNSVAKGILGALTGLIGGASAALGGAAVAGVKYNSEMEQYITSFGTMLGGADKATAMVADLKKFAADTPFEFNDLAKGTQTLLAFGVSAKDVMPDMQMLGDVSQGNVDRFNSLALAFAQVSSAGKMQGQDLLQFVNAGFNPLNEMARTTGKSMADLRTEMGNGQISAQDVANAFKSATSAGGQFYQAMNAQSKTFSGQLSTLKDNAMQFLGELTAGLQNNLKDTALPMVNGWMDELQSAFAAGGVDGVVQAFGGVLAKALQQVTQQIPAVLTLGAKLITSFAQGIRENADQFSQSIISVLGSFAGAAATVIPQVLWAAQNLVQAFIVNLSNDFKTNKSAIVSAFSSFMQGALATLPEFAETIGGDISGIIADVLGMIPIFLPKIIQLAVQLIEAFAEGLLENAPQIISAAEQAIGTLVQALLQAAPQLAAAAIQLMVGFYGTLMQQNPPVGIFLTLIGAVKGLQGAFKGLDDVATAAKGLQNAGSISAKIAAPFKKAGDNIGVLKGVISDFGGSFKTVGSGIIGVAKNIGGGFASLGKTIAGGLMSSIKGLASGLSGVFTFLAENPIILVIAGIALLVLAIIHLWNTNEGFRDAVTGIWDGILNVFQAVIGAIVGIFTKTIPAAWAAFIGFMKTWGPLILAIIFPILGIPLLIVQHWQQIVDFFAGLPQAIGFALGFALGTIVKWGTDLVAWATTAIPAFIGSVVTFFSQLPGQIWGVITSAFQAIVNFGVNLIGWATTAVPQFISSVISFFASLPGLIWGAIVGAVSLLGAWGGQMLSTAVNAAANLIANVISFYASLPGRIRGAIVSAVSVLASWGGQMLGTARNVASSVINGIVGFFAGLPGDLENIGRNIVQGLWNGITGAWKMITDGVKNLTGGFVNGFKAALGIHSPSRLFRDEIGKMLPPGIAIGFEDAIPAATADMQAQMDDLTAQMQTSVSAQQNITAAGVTTGASNTVIYVQQPEVSLQVDKREIARANNGGNYTMVGTRRYG